mmetsp:Transcript_14110/g.33952  ORF Transcript_14110/g.33952 Transcript_14110/m.33952 type:complete len:155 (-) Transcript_14110:876-1340(-)
MMPALLAKTATAVIATGTTVMTKKGNIQTTMKVRKSENLRSSSRNKVGDEEDNDSRSDSSTKRSPSYANTMSSRDWKTSFSHNSLLHRLPPPPPTPTPTPSLFISSILLYLLLRTPPSPPVEDDFLVLLLIRELSSSPSSSSNGVDSFFLPPSS